MIYSDANELLRKLFPNWKMGQREYFWLWLFLIENGESTDSLGTFGSFGMEERMGKIFAEQPLLVQVATGLKSYTFLPLHDFNFIKEHGRQPQLLLDGLLDNLQSLMQGKPMPFERVYANSQKFLSLCPPSFSTKEKIIALFDIWNEREPQKKQELKYFKEFWAERQRFEQKLSWYSCDKNEKQKLQIAWQWYNENHYLLTRSTPKFSKMDDILSFLDESLFRDDEMLYHLTQIKKKFRYHQTKANREAKTQTNMSLSNEVREQLDELARINNCTKTKMVELLIREEYETQVKK
jgi:hypothetical protein